MSLDDHDRALVEFSIRLTKQPGTMTASDLVPLRSAGFEDAAILWLTEVVAYFNFVNRMADGLGVELEPGREDYLGSAASPGSAETKQGESGGQE